MLKLVGIIFLISACGLTGFLKSKKVSNRVLFIEQYISLMSYIETQIRYSAGDLVQVLRQYKLSSMSLISFIEDCVKSSYSGEAFFDAWCGSVDNISKDYGLKSEDLSLIKGFGEGLGVSDIEGQMLHCEMSKKLAFERLNNARVEKQKKCRLYQMIGVSFGICIALIFI